MDLSKYKISEGNNSENFNKKITGFVLITCLFHFFK